MPTFIVPVAIVTMMLPISINGIGVREGVSGIARLYGVELSSSLAFAWIIHALVLGRGLLAASCSPCYGSRQGACVTG
jgi:hypothetical protein